MSTRARVFWSGLTIAAYGASMLEVGRASGKVQLVAALFAGVFLTLAMIQIVNLARLSGRTPRQG